MIWSASVLTRKTCNGPTTGPSTNICIPRRITDVTYHETTLTWEKRYPVTIFRGRNQGQLFSILSEQFTTCFERPWFERCPALVNDVITDVAKYIIGRRSFTNINRNHVKPVSSFNFFLEIYIEIYIEIITVNC